MYSSLERQSFLFHHSISTSLHLDLQNIFIAFCYILVIGFASNTIYQSSLRSVKSQLKERERERGIEKECKGRKEGRTRRNGKERGKREREGLYRKKREEKREVSSLHASLVRDTGGSLHLGVTRRAPPLDSVQLHGGTQPPLTTCVAE